eukprot:5294102-Amphidinium_carterae.1
MGCDEHRLDDVIALYWALGCDGSACSDHACLPNVMVGLFCGFHSLLETWSWETFRVIWSAEKIIGKPIWPDG